MHILKKLEVILIIAIILCIGIVGKSYAAVSCNVTIVGNENITAEGKFSVEVKVSNINSPTGLLALGAKLEYDTGKLDYIGMEMGSGAWAVPSYNSANGKLVTDRNNYGKNTETVFKITFQAKKGATGNATIALKNISVADDSDEKNVGSVVKTVNIQKASSGNQGGNEGGNQGGSQGGNEGGNQGGSQGGNEGGNQSGSQGGNQGNNQGSNPGGNQGGSTNQGGSAGGSNNSGSTNNKKPTSTSGNKTNTGSNTEQNVENNQEPDNQETNTDLEIREEENNNDNEFVNTDNIDRNDIDKEQEDVKLVEGKKSNSALIIVLIILAIILVVAIVIIIGKARARDRRTKKIEQINKRDDNL